LALSTNVITNELQGLQTGSARFEKRIEAQWFHPKLQILYNPQFDE
jgi:hypothetical protein